MYILLTDALTCPRCGPDFGLLVLSDRMEDRRVIEGALGCPNCRTSYPIRNAAADLRAGASAATESAASTESAGAAESAEPGPTEDGAEGAMRLAALMGLAGASGLAMVAGPGARHAAAVSALVPELEVVAVTDRPDMDPAREPGVSRLAAGDALPFRGGALRAAALTGGAGDARLREGLRVLQAGARLVVDGAEADTAERLRALGAEVLLEEDGVVVARAPGRPVELRRNAVR
ncbi:Trm112 family protein [Longimicrobium sp.]|uniref:Trm112 family protein n=1 Tax=Longimicrobium sp. TaxID=2029185 RepID=UPI003B3A0840